MSLVEAAPGPVAGPSRSCVGPVVRAIEPDNRLTNPPRGCSQVAASSHLRRLAVCDPEIDLGLNGRYREPLRPVLVTCAWDPTEICRSDPAFPARCPLASTGGRVGGSKCPRPLRGGPKPPFLHISSLLATVRVVIRWLGIHSRSPVFTLGETSRLIKDQTLQRQACTFKGTCSK